ncbi:MAG TPA: glycine cleavage system aminomethyltransferase GcvT [Acidimicrobiales bacterium]
MSSPRSPLDAQHRALGAKMVPFGGWEMPLAYPQGTLHEHRRCREAVVVFDVSHLGTVRVSGAGAFDRLQEAFTNDLRKIGPGRAQYTHLLDEADGSVLDDIIVLWLDDETFDVMPNASNTAAVLDALRDGEQVDVRDITRERAVLAVQGPQTRAVLDTVWPEAAKVGRFRVERVLWRDTPCVVSGTGYTGEDGVELAVPVAVAEEVWQAVLDAGVEPAGLGARDTLRLEAGLPLHGHELGPGITPLQAGLGWVVAWDKGPFRGRAALERERERGVPRRLRGLAVDGRRPLRAGQAVTVDGKPVGVVTSGNFSPTLGHAIALALLDPSLDVGASVEVDVRGSAVTARVVPTPFVGR